MKCKECLKELNADNHNSRYGNWCNDCKNAYQKKYRLQKGYIYDQSQYQQKHKAKKGIEVKVNYSQIQRDNFIKINGIEIY